MAKKKNKNKNKIYINFTIKSQSYSLVGDWKPEVF